MESWFIVCTFTGIIALQFFVILYLVFILHNRHVSERNLYRSQIDSFFDRCLSLMTKDFSLLPGNSKPRLMIRSDEEEARIEQLREML